MDEIISYNLIVLKEQRRRLRREATEAEEVLWRFLRKNDFGVRFRRQLSIEYFIVDFCCWKYKLIIEVDGAIHNDPEVAEYDKFRQQHLESLGFHFLRFSNDEVLKTPKKVVEKIKIRLQNLSTPSSS